MIEWLFQTTTIGPLGFKNLSILSVGLLFVILLSRRKNVLVSFSMGFVGMLYYETLWYLFYGCEINNYAFALLHGLGLTLIIAILVKLYHIKFAKLRLLGLILFTLTSLFFLSCTGFYAQWYAFERGITTLNPHGLYPAKYIWAVGKTLSILLWGNTT